MRVVIQRVSEASVSIDNAIYSKIGKGLVVLAGIEADDKLEDIIWLAGKIVNMRIFADSRGLMNKSLCDVMGEALIVSQFTLFASTKKGNRPSFIRAAPPEFAAIMFEIFCNQVSKELSRPVKTGIFAADMKVSLINDGPVTITMDTAVKE
jgi:D-tyrosyl-tRNA(Tyr) deacylase